ncbi:MFS transporter [Sphingomonas sp. BLCC-B65]|nr:MFS transporter [Sphingomonas sp. BLCC-B65]
MPDLSTSAARRRAVLATAFAFLVAMMGTTLPTPLYSIYSDQLSFTSLTVTILFAVYAVGVVGALLLFGRLSDDLGRRPVMMASLTLALLSAVLFLLPPSLPLLVVARVVSGLAAGLMSGTGTAAILDLYAPGRKAAAGTLAVAVNTGGLALGTLTAGILAANAPLPLVTPFVVHAALCALALVGLGTCAPQSTRRGPLRVRAHRLHVPREIRPAFVRGVLAAGAGFAVTGVLTAVSAILLARYLHLDSHALSGFVVFLAFAGMAVGQLIARRMRPRVSLVVGCLGIVSAATALAGALAFLVLPLLIAAAIVLGIAAGLCLNAGIATTVEKVEPAHRGEVSSSFFAGLYAMLAVPAIGVGVLANVAGLREAGLVFTGVVGLLAIAIAVLEVASARTPRR